MVKKVVQVQILTGIGKFIKTPFKILIISFFAKIYNTYFAALPREAKKFVLSMDKDIIIETDRLILRQWKLNDVNDDYNFKVRCLNENYNFDNRR